MATELKTFQTEFIDKKQNIIIPLLQRDYVQGGRFDVIEPFLGQLISALKDDNAEVNLNYIYGYNKGDDGFVPIDGQQRLITLWLLHLYLNPLNFEVNLQFESREFADNFCEQLRIKLYDILEEQKQVKSSLKDLIIDSEWFVSGWLLDTTVSNMLNTLQLIDDSKKRIPYYPHLKNITFDFLNLKDKGIDEDVYVKMNGRGRPLSYFENLKSWMDEQVKVKSKLDEDFSKEWQIKMDNEWTELFWENRNTEQKHSEEIDDEQIRFFYSMLLLYWKKKGKEFLTDLTNEEKNTKSQYISFLNEWEKDDNNKLSDNSPIEDVQKKTFTLLLKGEKMIPIYWIEEISLFNNEVFKFIKNGLETLEEIKGHTNEMPDSIISVLDFKSKQTVLYNIALKDASYAKTLPLLYALIKTPKEYRNKTLYKWMRLWRNLALNSDITAENIKNACETIDMVSSKVSTNNLYQVISELHWEHGFAFSEKQFNEEIAKAKQIILNERDHNCGFSEDDILFAEQHPLLKGCISTLFEKDNCEIVSFGQSLRDRIGLLDDLWNQKNNNSYRLVKVLISQYDDKERPDGRIPLIRTEDNWKILVTDKLKDCFRRNRDNSIKECSGWKKKISCSELIENSRNYNSDKSLGIYGDKVVLWGTKGCTWNAYENVILDDFHNNSWLACLINDKIVESNQKVKNCDFFWGLDIWFKFQGNFFTNYMENNTICLMNDNWNGKKLKNQENPDTPENNFYFSVDEKETEDSFLHKLDCLIAQAFPDTDKSVCLECK